jgi:endo-1,4-beta-xylanase
MKQLKHFLIIFNCMFALVAYAQDAGNEKTLKEVYKNAFLIGVAVNPAITSGKDNESCFN